MQGLCDMIDVQGLPSLAVSRMPVKAGSTAVQVSSKAFFNFGVADVGGGILLKAG